MTNIPRATSAKKLIDCLLSPRMDGKTRGHNTRPRILVGITMSGSRLNNEQSVATIEISDPPPWLQFQNTDRFESPKQTALGTLWRSVATGVTDEQGQTELIRVMSTKTNFNINYAKMLAEFADTDINIQDNLGRTALHWACVLGLPDMIWLCLSVPDCDIGLRDNDNLMAFDILQHGLEEVIPSLFYKDIVNIAETNPQAARLRVLKATPPPTFLSATVDLLFRGTAVIDPIQNHNKLLLHAIIMGIDLIARNQDGDTALHVAVKVENVELAWRLLTAGSDVNAEGNGGATPLHYAARAVNQQMVQLLLEWGAKPDIQDDAGKTALELAKDTSMILLELERQSSDKQSLTTLHRAVEAGDTNLIQLLLDLGVDVEEKTPYGETSLIMAARMGNLRVEKVLLDRNADIGARDNVGGSALQSAVVNRHLDMVLLLLDRGANIETKNYAGLPVLHLAIIGGCLDIVLLLLDRGANIDRKDDGGRPVLHLAIAMQHLDLVLSLLALGANTSMTDHDGWSALHLAVASGRLDMVLMLLDWEANPTIKDNVGWTPLHLAVVGGELKFTQLLLDRGANIAAIDGEGRPVLHWAAAKGLLEIVHFLLEKNADIAVVDVRGKSALYWAERHGRVMVSELLQKHGADLAEEVGSGQTALQLVEETQETDNVRHWSMGHNAEE